MKVTPINRKFGKHRPGDVFEFPDKAARAFIKAGKLQEADSTEPAPLAYRTRMMQAGPPVAAPTPVEAETVKTPAKVEKAEPTPVETTVDAPYGLKKDGTPRKAPGRAAKSE